MHVQIRTNFFKSCVYEKIEQINKTKDHIAKAIQSDELESNKETNKCADKNKNSSNAHGINGKEIPQAHMKIKKRNLMVVFLSINAVNNSALQPLNVHAQHRKQPSVR